MSVTQKMESERGRIGKEIKHGLDKNGKPWVNFSLAVDETRGTNRGTGRRSAPTGTRCLRSEGWPRT